MTDLEGSVWRHIRLGVWKNIETGEELTVPVCLNCNHAACPVCATWCDVLDDDGTRCCNGRCHYETRPHTPSDNLDGCPHMCRLDRENPLKRTVLVL